MSATNPSLADLIEDIEKAYEYMLAYAAQGRRGDEEGSEIHEVLTQLQESLAGLAAACSDLRELEATESAPFLALVQADRERAGSAVGIVLSRKLISSQLIDNLNASIHLRTLLTDLFLLDECLRS